jgi:hypothetical protein
MVTSARVASEAHPWGQYGESNRHYGSTQMNEQSSRSHVLFRLVIESRALLGGAHHANTSGTQTCIGLVEGRC